MFLYILSFVFILELGPIFWIIIDFDLLSQNIFLYEFLFAFSLNFLLSDTIKNPKLDFDLVYKYFILFVKTPNFFINYIFNVFKKIFVFLLYFKYKHLLLTTKILLNGFYKNLFIIGKPLFKKMSYFGFYRSNRSKWIK